MAAYKRFTGSGDGEFFKFDVAGKSIEGTFNGFIEGQYGPVMLIRQDGRTDDTKCSTNTGLLNCFDEAFGSYKTAPHGVKVKVTFIEAAVTKKGGTWKRYALDVDEGAVDGEAVPY